MKTCTKCGESKALTEYWAHPTTRDGRVGTCKTCKRQRYRLTCAGCSKPMNKTKGSRPQGEARCKACRIEFAIGKSRPTCLDCGDPAHGVRCRPCSFAYRRANTGITPRPDREARLRRYYTDKAAPGLNSWEKRRVLLRRWQQQGRPCAYCPAQAETVDHVIPLIRGGSNYEGNLVPCCLDCNVRKSDRLLIEWRLSKRASAGRVAVAIPPKAEPKAKPMRWVEQTLGICLQCNALHQGKADAAALSVSVSGTEWRCGTSTAEASASRSTPRCTRERRTQRNQVRFFL